RSVQSEPLRALLSGLVTEWESRLRIWPAARQVHHAYRSGLLEHILKTLEIGSLIAEAYGLRLDMVIAGALLHDIGKLQELSYEVATDYTVEGNLIGHIVIGTTMLREALVHYPEVPPAMAMELEHMILSHHGGKALGSPVTPMTPEA